MHRQFMVCTIVNSKVALNEYVHVFALTLPHKVVISGNYLPSCFGLSLELLVHLHTFVREATPTKLAKMVSCL